MTTRLKLAAAGLLVLGGLLDSRSHLTRGQERRVNRITAMSMADLRAWDSEIDRMTRHGSLELRLDREDTMLPGRRHRRFTQVVNGVPVYGGDIVRQTDANGVTVSIFGLVYDDIRISTEPRLTVEDARRIVTDLTGVESGPEQAPRLTVLPRADGSYTLTYVARVATPGDITLYFLDAETGRVVHQRSDAHRQTATVGLGTGVLGDRKKVSASSQAGAFVGSDRLRPPAIETYDMRGELLRMLRVLNGVDSPGAADLATDSDNDWDDGANVDAHTYAGYTYDYYFKRFGRRGLDNANIRIRNFTHPVDRADSDFASPEVFFTYYLNAFYAGDGIIVYGEGLPSGVPHGGQSWNYLAGGLDIAGHELTHGVTEYSSNLIYEGESGALNEAFSDIMGTAIEFFFQAPGNGPLRADYLVAEDVVTPGGIRSMANPRIFGDPDHYSLRYTGADDNGGVHINSGIANHAYYLAIEGGTNRTSGLAVQGIGQANRDQMEKIVYRAFTQLLPANATFATARAATLQAARDLYGAGSAAERALEQAWSAVGVN
jgi:bacillolysin